MYNTLGAINTIFIIVSLYGVFSQLRTIWRRKRQANTDKNSTALLSLNQFSVSYLAYFSFFVYGYSITPFNHYIVWPRLVASVLVAFILIAIWQDRRSKTSLLALMMVGIASLIGGAGLLFGGELEDTGKQVSTTLIVIVTLLIAQGYYHQIKLIINSKQTGAIDLKMSQFILMMDISTIAFALSMGLATGWPLLMLATVSAITKLIIMYLFNWVKYQKPLTQ